MKKHKLYPNTFTFYDRTGIEHFLKKQAEKGWMLEKTGGVFWKFRRIEPKKIYFALTYFPSASAYDPEPSENQLRFRDFCEYAGWRHLVTSAQMQIFYNENDDPVPIETDAVIETENIHKAAKKSYLPGYFMILAIGILILIMESFLILSSPVEHLSNNMNLFMLLLGICEITLGASELIQYYRWYKKAALSAEENGTFTETIDCKAFRILVPIFMLIVLFAMFMTLLSESSPYPFNAGRLFWIIVSYSAASFFSASVVSVILKKLKVSAKTNRVITSLTCIILSTVMLNSTTSFIINDVFHGNVLRESAGTYEYNGMLYSIYNDELPLYAEDLVKTDYDLYNTRLEIKSSPFLVVSEAYQRPRHGADEQPWLEYTVIDVKLGVFLGSCINDMIDEYHTIFKDEFGYSSLYEYRKSDPAAWNADSAYQLVSLLGGTPEHTYLICRDCRIVKISAGFHITDEHMAVISEKLFN